MIGDISSDPDSVSCYPHDSSNGTQPSVPRLMKGYIFPIATITDYCKPSNLKQVYKLAMLEV